MGQSINLIPRDEKVQQRNVKVVKLSSVLTVFVLTIMTGAAAYFWFSSNSLKSKIARKGSEIESSRRDIENMTEIEIIARTLDAKYQVLLGLYEDRRNYSSLISELVKRLPGNVEMESFSLAGDDFEEINISGRGSDYIAIARFINTLSDSNFSSAEEGLEKLFTGVTLKSVTLDIQDRSVKYFIVTSFNPLLIGEEQ